MNESRSKVSLKASPSEVGRANPRLWRGERVERMTRQSEKCAVLRAPYLKNVTPPRGRGWGWERTRIVGRGNEARGYSRVPQ